MPDAAPRGVFLYVFSCIDASSNSVYSGKINYCILLFIFVSHLPGVLVHFSLLASDYSGPSVGLAAGAGVSAATGDGGGWRWCGGRYRGRCRGGG